MKKPIKKQVIPKLILSLSLLEMADETAEFPVHVVERDAIYLTLLYLGLSKKDIKDKVNENARIF